MELYVASEKIMTLVPDIIDIDVKNEVFTSRDCIEFRTSDKVECPFTVNESLASGYLSGGFFCQGG